MSALPASTPGVPLPALLATLQDVEALASRGTPRAWRARDPATGDLVVVKLRLTEDDPEATAPWEGAVLPVLHHPAIPCLVDALTDAEVLVRGWVDGQPLALRAVRGPLDAATLTRVSLGLADALAHAHAAGVAHGRLDASHVLLDPSGAPRLIGFGGVPHRPPPPNAHTRALKVHPCIAPEQLRRQPWGPRADVYAVGTLMYLMATGKYPQSVARSLGLTGGVPRVGDVPGASALPERLEALILACLAPNPSDRPEDMRALAHATSALLGEPWTDPEEALTDLDDLSGLLAVPPAPAAPPPEVVAAEPLADLPDPLPLPAPYTPPAPDDEAPAPLAAQLPPTYTARVHVPLAPPTDDTWDDDHWEEEAAADPTPGDDAFDTALDEASAPRPPDDAPAPDAQAPGPASEGSPLLFSGDMEIAWNISGAPAAATPHRAPNAERRTTTLEALMAPGAEEDDEWAPLDDLAALDEAELALPGAPPIAAPPPPARPAPPTLAVTSPNAPAEPDPPPRVAPTAPADTDEPSPVAGDDDLEFDPDESTLQLVVRDSPLFQHLRASAPAPMAAAPPIDLPLPPEDDDEEPTGDTLTPEGARDEDTHPTANTVEVLLLAPGGPPPLPMPAAHPPLPRAPLPPAPRTFDDDLPAADDATDVPADPADAPGPPGVAWRRSSPTSGEPPARLELRAARTPGTPGTLVPADEVDAPVAPTVAPPPGSEAPAPRAFPLWTIALAALAVVAILPFTRTPEPDAPAASEALAPARPRPAPRPVSPPRAAPPEVPAAPPPRPQPIAAEDLVITTIDEPKPTLSTTYATQPAVAGGPGQAAFEGGLEALAAGEAARALEMFTAAYALQPDAESAYNIGLAFEDLGAHDAAMEWYQRVKDTWPDRASAAEARLTELERTYR